MGILKPVRLVRFAAPLVIGSFWLIGCETHVRRGSVLYADGRYIEAAEVFERTEYRLPQFTPRERAEYGLYRGMTLLVLGDLGSARRWLQYAYSVEQAVPGSLRADRRALLDRGWLELAERLRGEMNRALPVDSALATTQPGSAPASSEPGTSQPGAGERTLVPR